MTSSRNRLSQENVYRPGFLDHRTPEQFKMSLDRELFEISRAFYKTTERNINVNSRIDTIKVANNLVDVKSFTPGETYDFGVKNFDRFINFQCSFSSGVGVSTVILKVNDVLLQSMSITDHGGVPVPFFGSPGIHIAAGDPCVVNAEITMGTDGTFSVMAFAHKI